MAEEDKPKFVIGRIYDWAWGGRPEKERKRINSLVVLGLYTFGFLYFVIYLSILNSVNRNKTGMTVKNWFGGDPPELVQLKKERQQQIDNSFKLLRKPVSGGR
ncbi:MAG: hypothetical protein G3M70_04095 [Candidatus Nitronauta litoralis]|uniref:Uncharacterized protein n=1 Tax=Candidatus Nitronauta litoralis TaxID=2705533 RepID=A0A7T0BU93_9BACT|nr:MAG: hypothetical protein G3M70_04095 [Candidatus Nitronauta litoralis]